MPALSLAASMARLVANSLSRLSRIAKNEGPAAAAGCVAASAEARQPTRRWRQACGSRAKPQCSLATAPRRPHARARAHARTRERPTAARPSGAGAAARSWTRRSGAVRGWVHAGAWAQSSAAAGAMAAVQRHDRRNGGGVNRRRAGLPRSRRYARARRRLATEGSRRPVHAGCSLQLRSPPRRSARAAAATWASLQVSLPQPRRRSSPPCCSSCRRAAERTASCSRRRSLKRAASWSPSSVRRTGLRVAGCPDAAMQRALALRLRRRAWTSAAT